MSASRCSSHLCTSPTIVKSYVSLLVPRAMPSIRDTYSSGRRAWELRHSFSSRTSKLSNPTATDPSWVPLSAGHSVLVHVFMAGSREAHFQGSDPWGRHSRSRAAALFSERAKRMCLPCSAALRLARDGRAPRTSPGLSKGTSADLSSPRSWHAAARHKSRLRLAEANALRDTTTAPSMTRDHHTPPSRRSTPHG